MNQIKEGIYYFRNEQRPEPKRGQTELYLKDTDNNPVDCACKITSCESTALGSVLWGYIDVSNVHYLAEISLHKNVNPMDGAKISKNNSFKL